MKTPVGFYSTLRLWIFGIFMLPERFWICHVAYLKITGEFGELFGIICLINDSLCERNKLSEFGKVVNGEKTSKMINNEITTLLLN